MRAILLLGCLLALPILAICGSSLPDVLHTALEGRLPGIEPSPARPDREAPQFVPNATPEAGSRKETSNRVASPSVPNSQAQIEQRLQQLGASYYRLEEWGNRRECFRFLCEMPVGSDPNLARSFQAVRTDRLDAMADVLRQVETHRGG